jgi:hypothetical protein
VARLSYDPVRCQVWLDVLPERAGTAQEICDLHASRLTVPRGWMLCDRRVAAPALFVAEPEPEPDAPVGGVRVVPARRARPRVERAGVPAGGSEEPGAPPSLFDEPVPPTDEPVPRTDEPVSPDDGGTDEAAAEEVVADDELPPALRASSPLLARAFRSTGPQHSVLTQGTRTPRR